MLAGNRQITNLILLNLMSNHPNSRLTWQHQAMATTFTLVVSQADPPYARQAAEAIFAELDLIENRLSRFTEHSDISRMNHLEAGQCTTVHPDTWHCLRIALEIQTATQGAFDIAYASAKPPINRVAADMSPLTFSGDSVLQSKDSLQPEPPTIERGLPHGVGALGHDEPKNNERIDIRCYQGFMEPRIALEPHNQVRVLTDGVRLDLGGIGKGYALDRMAVLLNEWDLERALLSASTSTVLALQPPLGATGWPIQFGPEPELCHLTLRQNAFSGSGRAVQGSHIINPYTGQPAEGRFRAWAGAPTGAEADALSTAFMIMDEQDIAHLCKHQPQFTAFLQKSPKEPVVRIL
jgi:FAD:protein FMN transferase